ncbi:hypothetical protein KDA_31460 [Dictyobacter alpinus]|uniref:Uncharacterized protein n=1 Tax=Dictyobacter alpinus TaxID=2014873 RepID=A0A402B8M8_9CHLR|nr:hypothetical protein KDA_31460 [Dictyobacter alpinus]
MPLPGLADGELHLSIGNLVVFTSVRDMLSLISVYLSNKP